MKVFVLGRLRAVNECSVNTDTIRQQPTLDAEALAKVGYFRNLTYLVKSCRLRRFECTAALRLGGHLTPNSGISLAS